MKTARVLAAGALLAGPLLLSSVACDPPSPYASCGSVGTAPNSDVGAWNIKAHGPNCTTARDLALSWRNNSGGRPYVWAVTWHCTGAISGLPQLGSDVWCNGPNGAVVTFTNV